MHTNINISLISNEEISKREFNKRIKSLKDDDVLTKEVEWFLDVQYTNKKVIVEHNGDRNSVNGDTGFLTDALMEMSEVFNLKGSFTEMPEGYESVIEHTFDCGDWVTEEYESYEDYNEGNSI